MGGERHPVRRSATPTSPVVFKAFDDSHLTTSALLTGPVVDLGGDFVEPGGGRWVARPYVKSGQPIVGKHEGLIGWGRVELKSYTDDAGKSWTVPVGTTHYERGNKLAEQTYQLVKADVMPGVSIEFRGVVAKSRGYRNKFEPRDAMDYVVWDGLGWSHDAFQQNQLAQTFPPEVVAKARAVLSQGLLDGSPLHPVICKALSVYQTKATAVTGGFVEKAMDETALPGDDTATADASAASDLPPEASEAHDVSQGLNDFADMLDARAAKTLHGTSRKVFPKIAAQLRKMAEQCGAHGDAVVGEIDGQEPDVDVDADLDDDSDDVEQKAQRLYLPYPNAAPLVFKADGSGLIATATGYTPARRVLLSDLQEIPAPTVEKAEDESDSAALSMLSTELDALRRRNRRNERTARDLERARRANA